MEATSIYGPIVELRQYTLHPGQRDTLIDLFEREFIEGQESTGMGLIGQFRDLDDPDRFVWLRAFKDMTTRAEALQRFYSGPIWQANRGEANATMIDSDNVLLLHVATPDSNFAPVDAPRAATDAKGPGPGVVSVNIYYFDRGREREFVSFFERRMQPLLREAGIAVCASFVTETSANNFPGLPVRDKEFVFVWFAKFGSEAERAERLQRLQRSSNWASIEQQLPSWFARSPESLRLEPTARSQLHG